MKPHIYRRNGKWFCRRDYPFNARELGIASDTPTEAYFRARDYWKWA